MSGATWYFCGFDCITERFSCQILPSPLTLADAGALVGVDTSGPLVAGAYPLDLDALDVMTGKLVIGEPSAIDECDWFLEQIAEST